MSRITGGLMAVSVSTVKSQYTGNASTTAFAFSFPISATSEIKVYEDDTLKTLTTHYTVAATINDFAGGGTVTFVTAPATGVRVTLVRVTGLTSTINFTTGDTLPAETLESSFDTLQRTVQELADKANRSLQMPTSNDSSLSMALPNTSDRQTSYLSFDANGVPTTTATVSGIDLSTGDEGWTKVLQTANEKNWVTLVVSGANLTMANSTDHNKVSLILVTTGGSNRTILMPPETATGVSNVGRRIAVVKMDAGVGQIILQNDAAGSIGTNIVNRYDMTQLVCLSSTEWTSITENPVVNLVVPDAGTIGSASDGDAIAIGADGDVTLTQDLELQHDGATVSFGGNDEVSLTHVHDTGLLLNSTMQLQFNDASQNIQAPSATILDINATDEIELNATEVEINATTADVNANLDVSGTGVIGSTTASTSISTGALTVAGGVGVAGSLFAGNFNCFWAYDFGVIVHSGSATTGSDLAGSTAGTTYNANTDRFTTSYGSDTLTITIKKAGTYLVNFTVSTEPNHGNADATFFVDVTIGGTSTEVMIGKPVARIYHSRQEESDFERTGSRMATVVATADQTLTVKPIIHTAHANLYQDVHAAMAIIG